MKKLKTFLLDSLLLFSWLLFYIFFDNYEEIYKKIIGVTILCVSILIIYKVRYDKFGVIVFCIICYINITIVLSDCFTNGELSLPFKTLIWQEYRGSIYEIKFLMALLLFLTIVNCFIKETYEYKCENLSSRNNILCFTLVYGIMLIGLFTGYSKVESLDAYVSNTTTLYEYCTLFFIIAWYYSRNGKIRKGLLCIYSLLYIIQSILYGDRSSAFPMILLLFLIYVKKITIKKTILLAIAGIIFSNMIAVYRQAYSFDGFISNYLMRYAVANITSDTVSQSYYTGVSLVAVKEKIGCTSKYIGDYIMGIVLGGSFGNSNITKLGKEYATNKGGGLIISDFYFMLGLFGVLILAISISCFLNRLNKGDSDFWLAWKYYFAITVFRWYLYRAFDLCRGVWFVFPIAFIFLKFIDLICAQNGLKQYKSKIQYE